MNKEKTSAKETHFTPVMVDNPWDGGKMTLREFYEREEMEGEREEAALIPENLPDGQKMYLSHIRHNGLAYQFLFFNGKGYSGQSIFYRRQKNSERFKPLALECHIPEEYLLAVADAFEKGGVEKAQYMLGV